MLRYRCWDGFVPQPRHLDGPLAKCSEHLNPYLALIDDVGRDAQTMSALDQYCLSVFLARLIFLNEKHDRYRERECHLGVGLFGRVREYRILPLQPRTESAQFSSHWDTSPSISLNQLL